uniref:Putative conserved secreted protein n=1 Tax=Culex tarsalis TaxID=7177 RepID=A0A1Q3FR39_CULTA
MKLFLLISLCCVTGSLAGICQDAFKNSNDLSRPFFQVIEGQAIEIYYKKRTASQEMFGIKIYKNQDLRKKDLHCDLCVNTTLVEDGCFKIKSTLLSVQPRDELKYITLSKFTGKPEVTVAPSRKAEFTDYVIPASCVCKAPAGAGYCTKASTKITDYRPLFVFQEGTTTGVYLPKAPSTESVGLQALKNANFVPAKQQKVPQKLDLNVEQLSERDGCYALESNEPRFGLGDHVNFVVTGKKTDGKKIRTDPRKVYLNNYFIPSTCSCQQQQPQQNLVKPQPQKLAKN